MNNFDFLKKYQRLQKGIMFDQLVDLGFAIVSYCSIYDSDFWNNALTNETLSEDQVSQVESRLGEFKRKPSFYFENKDELGGLVEKLTKKGYSKSFEDCWQFWSGTEIDKKHFDSVKKVETEEDLKIFLETFDKCYQKNDPQNPYGELGDYLKVAEQAWDKHHATNRIEYFLVYEGDKPVAVSTLTNFEGLGYISNVGSLKEVRGRGFGKAATLYCVEESQKHGNKEHCLATEEGHYPNGFYNQIGFKTRFRAIAYTKAS